MSTNSKLNVKFYQKEEITNKKKFYYLMDLIVTNQGNNNKNNALIFLSIFYIQFISAFFSSDVEILSPENTKIDKFLKNLEEILRIIKVLIKSYKTYKIIIIAIFIFLILFTLLFLFSIYTTRQINIYSSKEVLIENILKIFMYVLFAPIIDLIFMIFSFTNKDRESTSTSFQIIIIFLNIIIFFYSIFAMIFLQIFTIDNLYIFNSPYAKISCGYEIIITCHCIINSILFMLVKHMSKFIFLFYNLITSFILMMYYLNSNIYYDSTVNSYIRIYHILYFYASFYFSLCTFISFDNKGLIFLVTSIIAIYLGIILESATYSKNLYKKEYFKLKNNKIILRYIKILIDKYHLKDKNIREKCYLNGILQMHSSECPDSSCISKHNDKIYLPKNEKWSSRKNPLIEDDIYIENLIVSIYNYFISKNFYSVELLLNLSLYYLIYIGNICQCIYYSSKAKLIKMSYQDYFSYKRLKFYINKMLECHLKKCNEEVIKPEELNCTYFFRYDDMSYNFLNEINNDLQSTLYFWYTLKLSKQNSIDYNKLFSLTDKIRLSKINEIDIFNKIMDLYNGANELFLLYMSYIEVINDDEFLKRNLESYKTKLEIANGSVINKVNYYQYLFNDETGIIIANCVNGKEGQIIKVNKSTTKIFKYSKEHLEKMNLSNLMPHIYGNKHKEFMRNFCNTGEKKVIDKKNFKVYAMDKNNNVISLNMIVKIFPVLNKNILFISLFNKCKNDDVIITDNMFNIQGMSEKIYDKFSKNEHAVFNDYEIPFYCICLQFLAFYQNLLISKVKSLDNHLYPKKGNVHNNRHLVGLAMLESSISPNFQGNNSIINENKFIDNNNINNNINNNPLVDNSPKIKIFQKHNVKIKRRSMIKHFLGPKEIKKSTRRSSIQENENFFRKNKIQISPVLSPKLKNKKEKNKSSKILKKYSPYIYENVPPNNTNNNNNSNINNTNNNNNSNINNTNNNNNNDYCNQNTNNSKLCKNLRASLSSMVSLRFQNKIQNIENLIQEIDISGSSEMEYELRVPLFIRNFIYNFIINNKGIKIINTKIKHDNSNQNIDNYEENSIFNDDENDKYISNFAEDDLDDIDSDSNPFINNSLIEKKQINNLGAPSKYSKNKKKSTKNIKKNNSLKKVAQNSSLIHSDKNKDSSQNETTPSPTPIPSTPNSNKLNSNMASSPTNKTSNISIKSNHDKIKDYPTKNHNNKINTRQDILHNSQIIVKGKDAQEQKMTKAEIEFHRILKLIKTLFKDGDLADLEDLLKSYFSNEEEINEKISKFYLSFNKYKFGENNFCFIIKCLESKENISLSRNSKKSYLIMNSSNYYESNNSDDESEKYNYYNNSVNNQKKIPDYTKTRISVGKKQCKNENAITNQECFLLKQQHMLYLQQAKNEKSSSLNKLFLMDINDYQIILEYQENYLKFIMLDKKFQNEAIQHLTDISKFSKIHGQIKNFDNKDEIILGENASQSMNNYNRDLSKKNKIEEIRQSALKSVSNNVKIRYLKLIIVLIFLLIFGFFTLLLFLFESKTKRSSDLVDLNNELFYSANMYGFLIVTLFSFYALTIYTDNNYLFYNGNFSIYVSTLKGFCDEWSSGIQNSFGIIEENFGKYISENYYKDFWKQINSLYNNSKIYDPLSFYIAHTGIVTKSFLKNYSFSYLSLNSLLTIDRDELYNNSINLYQYEMTAGSYLNLYPVLVNKLNTYPLIFQKNIKNSINTLLLVIIVFCLVFSFCNCFYCLITYSSNKEIGEVFEKIIKIKIDLIEEIIAKIEAFKNNVNAFINEHYNYGTEIERIKKELAKAKKLKEEYNPTWLNDSEENDNSKSNSSSENSTSNNKNNTDKTFDISSLGKSSSIYNISSNKKLKLLMLGYIHPIILILIMIFLGLYSYLIFHSLFEKFNNIIEIEVYYYGQILSICGNFVKLKFKDKHDLFDYNENLINSGIYDYENVFDSNNIQKLLNSFPEILTLSTSLNRDICGVLFNDTQKNLINTCLNDNLIQKLNNTNSLLLHISYNLDVLTDIYQININDYNASFYNTNYFEETEHLFYNYLIYLNDAFSQILTKTRKNMVKKKKILFYTVNIAAVICIFTISIYLWKLVIHNIIRSLSVSRVVLKIIPVSVITSTPELETWIENEF